MKKAKRLAMCLLLLVLVFSALTVTALAADETTPASSSSGISNVVINTWTGVRGQIKTVCDQVVFKALGGGLAIWFVVSCCMCYNDYKKSHSINITAPIVLFVCTIVAFTAPLYIWSAIGW